MPRRKKLLLVHHELEELLLLMRALVRQEDNYDVMVALNGAIAKQIVREQPIHAIAANLSMPDTNGIDLLLWVAKESPETQAALLSAEIEEARDQAYSLGMSVIKMPFEAEEVRQTVTGLLDDTAVLNGGLAHLSFADLAQMLCLNNQTLVLRVEEGAESGLVMIKDGALCHAVWGDLEGEAAVHRALRVEKGSFQTMSFPESCASTISRDWRDVLMDSLDRDEDIAADEVDPALLELIEVRTGQVQIPATPAPEPEPPKQEEPSDAELHEVVSSFLMPTGEIRVPERLRDDGVVSTLRQMPDSPSHATDLLEDGFAAVKKGDYKAALRCWRAARLLDPENQVVALNLRKLRRMGWE